MLEGVGLSVRSSWEMQLILFRRDAARPRYQLGLVPSYLAADRLVR